MGCRSLALQPSPKYINGVNDTSAHSAADRAYPGGHNIPRAGIFLVTVSSHCIAVRDELLKILESGEVDSAVGKHANKTHGEAAIEGADARRAPHLTGGSKDERVAVEAAFNGFALHAARKVSRLIRRKNCSRDIQFECVERIYTESSSRLEYCAYYPRVTSDQAD